MRSILDNIDIDDGLSFGISFVFVLEDNFAVCDFDVIVF